VSQTFGRYEARELLGRGAMGEVYRGRDPVLARPIAIKVLSPACALPADLQKEFRERFLREARAAASLNHPNIVAVYDAGVRDDGTPFLVMELVEGASLEAIVSEDGPFAPTDAARAGEQLARALAVAHAAGIIHRDVKPANALRGPDGVVKLMDFGIARLAESKLTKEGSFLGSPTYSSPEQIRGGQVEAPGDLFSLGVTIYVILLGKNPFLRKTLPATAKAIVSEDPAPPSSLRPELDRRWDELMAQILAKDPGARFASADAAAAAFADLLGPAAPAPELELVVVAGPDRGMVAPLTEVVEIGRGGGHLALTDSSASSRHCRVERRGDGAVVRDHGSTNGVWFAGERVQEAELREGAQFSVGSNTRIVLQRPGVAISEPVAPNPPKGTVLDGGSGASPSLRPLSGAPSYALRIKEGPRTGQVFPVIGSLVLGRDDGEVQLGDERASRRHAQIEMRSSTRCVLRDLASSNGTWMGEQRIREVELRPGDEFRIGSTVVVFEQA